MLDRAASTLIKPAIDRLARILADWGLGANQMTVIGFGIGIGAAALIATGHFMAAAATILLSRLCDGLDGAIARRTHTTDAGGFLDIALDFIFYAAIPLAFALADPARNALPAALLLAAFCGTMSSFLAFAVIAAKRQMDNLSWPEKSFYFLGGLTEATETLACFVAMCIWPQHFPILASVYAAMCAITTATRVWWGWRAFS
ncbi:MAG: CDP-alcohol phosphatidyltransferase family protein [Rhodoferax sp.]|nr:CDP-alcohol phosphatidyltransferase family protein [Rhodoferax sp.]HQZ06432.1 CDP-alcohol phosphatidyltransferase family protein [Burkholderiaceae bacterium]HRA62603.1 CDP-alcohol phosphatidyltransferase family protein [Burkholderiaceae bacterium]